MKKNKKSYKKSGSYKIQRNMDKFNVGFLKNQEMKRAGVSLKERNKYFADLSLKVHS